MLKGGREVAEVAFCVEGGWGEVAVCVTGVGRWLMRQIGGCRERAGSCGALLHATLLLLATYFCL